MLKTGQQLQTRNISTDACVAATENKNACDAYWLHLLSERTDTVFFNLQIWQSFAEIAFLTTRM